MKLLLSRILNLILLENWDLFSNESVSINYTGCWGLIQILRGNGASKTLFRGVLTLSHKTCNSVLLQSIELGDVSVLLHRIYLKSDLITDSVIVGVRPKLPIYITWWRFSGGISWWILLSLTYWTLIMSVIWKKKSEFVLPALLRGQWLKKQIDNDTGNISLSWDSLKLNETIRLKSMWKLVSNLYSQKVIKENIGDNLSRNKLIIEQRKDPDLIQIFIRSLPLEEAG